MSDSRVRADFAIEGVDRALVVQRLTGREAISELFSFELDVVCDEPSLDFDALIGAAAHLHVWSGEGERHVHGIIAELEQTGGDDDHTFYRAVLVPRAWMLDLGRDCRIFAEATAPDVIRKVLEERGIDDVRVSLGRRYDAREIVVQYRESEWALCCRLMEDEGIHAYFQHDAEASTLVITDAAGTHDAIANKVIAFRRDNLAGGDGVDRFDVGQRMRPSKVTLRDYPFDQPLSTVEDTAEQDGDKGISVYDFPDKGARARLQALTAGRRRGRGTARSIRLVPGAIFELDGHPRPSFNAGWLVTAVEHDATFDSGDEGAGYRVTFECVPANQPYRPERKTPRPRILGAQTATVVRPQKVQSNDDTEIHTDDAGRVLVRFHWDHDRDGSPCWIPVAHYAASRGFGAVQLPRVGDSVLVEFLDGDPDRPIVSGSLYHKVNTPPYALPKNRTKAVFRDASTPHSGGYNELSFDSAAGQEEVYLRAQRNSRVQVLRDAQRTVGQDDALSVERDQRLQVGGERTASVGGDDSLKVGGDQMSTIEGDRRVMVGGDQLARIVGDREDVVQGDRTAAVVGDDELLVEGDQSNNVGGNRSTVISGNDVTSVGGSRAESVDGNLQLLVDGTTFEMHGALQVAVSGNSTFKCEGEVLSEAGQTQKIGAPKVYISAGTQLYLRAKESIVLEVGNSKITIEDDEVTITSGGAHKKFHGEKLHLNC